MNCEDVRFQFWRLWTYQWCHGSLWHVLINVLGNLVIGGELEAVHTTWNIAWLYNWGVLTGALFMATVQPHTPVVGSSGGVWTLLGARVANIILNGGEMATLKPRICILGLVLGIELLKAVVNTSEATSHAAHFGGLICGLLFGPQWLENQKEEKWETKLIRWFHRIYWLLVIFAVAWYWSQPPGAPQGLFETAGHCSFR